MLISLEKSPLSYVSDGEEMALPVSPRSYDRRRRRAIITHIPPVVHEPPAFCPTTCVPQGKEQLNHIIQRSFVFSHLDEIQKEQVIDSMLQLEIHAGTTIIKHGKDNDFFYVIESGEVDVFFSPDTVAATMPNAKLRAADCFEELALIHDAPCAITAIANTDCKIWSLNRQTYRRFLMESVKHKREQYQNFLFQVPFFAMLDRSERLKLCDAIMPQSCPAGTLVVKEGDIGTRFFIIESGEVAVLKNRPDSPSSPTELERLSSPQVFGELALLSDVPLRHASVVSLTPCRFLTVDKEAFQRLLGPLEEILKRNPIDYEERMKRIETLKPADAQ